MARPYNPQGEFAAQGLAAEMASVWPITETDREDGLRYVPGNGASLLIDALFAIDAAAEAMARKAGLEDRRSA